MSQTTNKGAPRRRPSVHQRKVSKLITLIGVENLAKRLKIQPRSVALWIERGVVPVKAIPIIQQVYGRLLHLSEYDHQAAISARKHPFPANTDAINKRIEEIGEERLSEITKSTRRNVLIWRTRGRFPDGVWFNVLHWTQRAALNRLGYEHPPKLSPKDAAPWRSLPGTEFIDDHQRRGER